MTSSARRVVAWDSCVFLHFLKKTKEHVSDLAAIWREANAGKFKILASTLTVSEVLRLNGDLSPTDELTIRNTLYDEPVVLHHADLSVCEIARDIRRKHKIYTPDAIHLATAIRIGAEAFLTYDKNRRNGRVPPLDLNKSVGAPPLEIITPGEWVKRGFPLFGSAIPVADS